MLFFSQTYFLPFKNIHIHTVFQAHTFSFKQILSLSFERTHTHTHTHHPLSLTFTHSSLSLKHSDTLKVNTTTKKATHILQTPCKARFNLAFDAHGHKMTCTFPKRVQQKPEVDGEAITNILRQFQPPTLDMHQKNITTDTVIINCMPDNSIYRYCWSRLQLKCRGRGGGRERDFYFMIHSFS